jgi:hypothetical protein
MKEAARTLITLAVSIVSAVWLAHIAAIESGITP